eukprot:COSAG01_NODE_24379_length_781_cov_1.278592_2_plen_34_part_01
MMALAGILTHALGILLQGRVAIFWAHTWTAVLYF